MSVTPKQVAESLRRLGDLTPLQAAAVFGTNQRSVRKWLSGERPVPPEIETLMRLLLKETTPAEIADDWKERAEAAERLRLQQVAGH